MEGRFWIPKMATCGTESQRNLRYTGEGADVKAIDADNIVRYGCYDSLKIVITLSGTIGL